MADPKPKNHEVFSYVKQVRKRTNLRQNMYAKHANLNKKIVNVNAAATVSNRPLGPIETLLAVVNERDTNWYN